MIKALVLKELRETLGVVAIAMAFYLYFTAKAMRHDLWPWSSTDYDYSSLEYFFQIPFVSWQYLLNFAWVSAGLAIALGFRQSLGESIHSTWLFLLHRPAGRTRLIAVKLLVGIVLYFVCAAAVLLAYAAWAATPGNHASPFAWSMTAPAWKILLTVPVLYLGAFLSGIRPARWIGTRLLPLAATGILIFTLPGLRWWPILGLGLVMLTCVILVSAIFFAARTCDF